MGALLRLLPAAVLLGILLAALYEGMRGLRVLLLLQSEPRAAIRWERLPPRGAAFLPRGGRRLGKRMQAIVLFLSDLVFCLLAAAAFAVFFAYANSGIFRASLFLCSILGFFLFRVTFGRLFRTLLFFLLGWVRTALLYPLCLLLPPLARGGKAVLLQIHLVNNKNKLLIINLYGIIYTKNRSARYCRRESDFARRERAVKQAISQARDV